MPETPKQPSAPPRGTSPSKAHDMASKTSYDSWNQHGYKTPQEALSDCPQKNPINPESVK